MVRKAVFRKYKASNRKVPKPVKKYVSRVLDRNVEDKRLVYELPSTFASISTSWTERDLFSAIAQGSATGQRIGRAIKIKSIALKGVLASGASELAVDDPYNVVRMLIGKFTGSSANPLTTLNLPLNQPLRKTDNGRNFLHNLYYDKYIPLQVTSTEKGAGDGYTPGLKQVSFYKRFKTPMKLTWGNDSTDYPQYRIYVACRSDSVAVVNPGFVAGYIEVFYEDA